MPTRCTFYFLQTNTTYGWTESHWNSANGFNSGLKAAQQLLPFMVNLRGYQTRLYRIRVTLAGSPRQAYNYLVPYNSQNSATSIVPSAGANDALNVFLTGFQIANGKTYIRGFPASVISLGGQVTPGPLWSAYFEDWLNQLITGGWQIRYQNPPPAGGGTGAVPFQINGYAYDAVHFLNVWNSIPGHGIAINPPYPRVNITGLRGYGAASGVQQVVSVTNANIFSTKSTICLPSSSALNGQGQVVSYAYTNIVEAQIATFTHRITGRPSNAPRGRQRAR